MAELVVGPIMEKIINACSDYLEEQVGWQTGMKKELESLRENHPKIQAVVLAANQAQINDQNHPINKWIWELRDALDEVNDALDLFEYMKHQEQLKTRNMEETKKRTAPSSNASFLFGSAVKVAQGALKIDPNMKRLEEVVQKLNKISAGVTNFLHLLDIVKQEQKEQEVDFYRTRETGYLPKNDLIGRVKKERVMEWLRNPSQDDQTNLYRNISLLCIMGHGGMGRTTLVQHIYEDERTKEFDLKIWVCVSNKFDVKKVIADMLEYLDKKKPDLDSFAALQRRLQIAVRGKKFLLILDDIWVEEENRDMSKWGTVLAPLAYGKFGSRILATTQEKSFAVMIAALVQKKTEIFRLDDLEEDHFLQFLNSDAFAGLEKPLEDLVIRYLCWKEQNRSKKKTITVA